MPLHVFVAMPFGMKEGINFDTIYDQYIEPAIESAGYEVFRADKELRAGEIRADMFQELLLADLVIADLTIDNPNVWYELGVRHALRARGIILIQSTRESQPFDIYTDRKLHYHLKDGVPDPDFLEADMDALTSMATETMASWHSRKISPVYILLPNLMENDWKSLRVGKITEFWEKHEEWEKRVKVAQEKMRPQDIIVLAAEAPVQILRMEAYRCAGKSLLKLGQFSFALEQYEEALSVDPEDLESLMQKGILLGRLAKFEEAGIHIKDLAEKNPDNAEILALLGRVEKDRWVDTWRKEGRTVEEMKNDAAREDAILLSSIEAYKKGSMMDPAHYYSAINTATLIRLLHHLTGDESMFALYREMEGGIRWCIRCALSRETPECKDYWARATLGDLEVLCGDTAVVERAYKDAVAAAGGDRFALESSLQQLCLLRDLGFRPEQVGAAILCFDRVMEKLEAVWKPRKVFLFSGHMIDAPDRRNPRFPPGKEKLAAQAIERKLDELGASSDDLALCGGACGGDLLFAEACLARDMRIEIRIPFDEQEFLPASVTFAGEQWRERFYTVKRNRNTKLYSMPAELGTVPPKKDPYERNNLWQLYAALAWGADKLDFICLWNGEAGDGPGGTGHMYDEVKKRSGRVFMLDTKKLWR
ncbi:MAG: DUF4071 domain-containing protein [Spirochaetales bacterium]|nr:DUF4071 domain-containing protein [Spirochaetales bacterium]